MPSRTYLQSIIICLVIATLLAFYKIFDPATSVWFPSCVFYKFTALYCPGCGAQRALHSLLNGKLAAAAGFNILAIIYVPIACTVLVLKRAAPAVTKAILVGIHPIWYGFVGASIIIFWLMRNIPFEPFLRLAP